MMKKIAFSLLAAATFAQCTTDNSLDKYGENACGTAAVSYSEDIAPLLNAQCTACHGNGLATANFNIEGHSAAAAAGLSGQLLNRVDRALGDPMLMPPDGPLDSCSIEKIRAWIANGAPNN